MMLEVSTRAQLSEVDRAQEAQMSLLASPHRERVRAFCLPREIQLPAAERAPIDREPQTVE